MSGIVPLDDQARATFEHIKNMYSSQGKRCLLLARKVIAKSADSHENLATEEAKSGLTIVGLVAIVDPLRPEIPEVTATLRAAGIRINMVCPPSSLSYLWLTGRSPVISHLRH